MIVARRVKPNWTGNSGIPPPVEEVVEFGVVEDVIVGLVLVSEVYVDDIEVIVVGRVMVCV